MRAPPPARTDVAPVASFAPVRRRAWLAGAAACLLAAGAAAPLPLRARDDGGRHRAEREQGRIVPLATLVEQVSRELPGRLLEAELDDDDGALVYELRWLLPDGRRLEIEIDARSGAWRSLKGHRLETVWRAGGARGAGR